MSHEIVAHYIKQITDLVISEWEPGQFDPAAFPEMATRILLENPIPEGVTLESVSAFALSSPELPTPKRPEYPFGEPPIELFHHEHFRLEAYLWANSTTDIHDHGFSGAFSLIHGSSLHSQYKFSPEASWSENVQAGGLSLTSWEILRRNDVRTILPGAQMIHSLFHLEHPSLTLCLRTNTEEKKFPQKTYFREGLALSAFHLPPRMLMQQRLLTSLSSQPCPSVEALLERFFETHTVEERVRGTLSVCNHYFYAQDKLKRFISAIFPEDKAATKKLWAVCQNQFVTSLLNAQRKATREPNLRLFLAVMLNLPNRSSLLACLESLFPNEEPVTNTVRFIRTLVQKNEDADHPTENSLGVTLSENHLGVLDGLLRAVGEKHMHEHVKGFLRSSEEPYDGRTVELALLTLPHTLALKPLFQ